LWNSKVIAIYARTQFKIEDRVASEVAQVASLKVAFLSSPMNSSNFR
jgi:hypothetical protein